MKKLKQFACALLCLMVLLCATGWQINTPAGAAREWTETITKGRLTRSYIMNHASKSLRLELSLLDEDDEDELDEALSALATMMRALQAEGITFEVRVTDVQMETPRDATVFIKVIVKNDGEVLSADADTISLTREDGEWKVCELDLD